MIDEKLIEILKRSGEIFMRYGIKSVTMDDVARELKISKKTLYKYVKDKKELVLMVMQAHCHLEQTDCMLIIKDAKNAIDEIIGITRHASKMVKEIHPSIHYDLEKYYTDAWEAINNHKNHFILNCIKDNLDRGVKEGLYRDNLNSEIVSRIYVQKIDLVFDGIVFPPSNYKFEEVYLEMMRYHVRGVASEKGLNYLLEKIKQEHLNL